MVTYCKGVYGALNAQYLVQHAYQVYTYDREQQKGFNGVLSISLRQIQVRAEKVKRTVPAVDTAKRVVPIWTENHRAHLECA
ncbi:hypothetical protein CEXT_780801 [Caerostris extrusa]|uniref:Uncharacterized protein n=1 Tax=Caerostris extrusa TaxID=172846 RepID=A0AAV4XBI8_CAEEX|nr:hypothetical protein CEXT_780801 [Caerostris extrusa]